MKGSRLRRLAVFAIWAVLLFLLVRAGADLWTARRLDAAVARFEQRHGRIDEGTLIVPPVQDGENGARVFRAAALLIDLTPVTAPEGERPRQHMLGVSLARLAQASPDAPLPDDLRAFVEANRAALHLARDARARSRYHWEADHVEGGNQPPWAQVRTLSNALYLAARRDLADGRVHDASTMAATGLALSVSVRQEPSLIAQLLRCAFGFQHLEMVQRLVTLAEPSRASLDELARWLAENRMPPAMEAGLRGEAAHVHRVLTRMAEGRIRPGDLGNLPEWVAPLARMWRPLVHLGHIDYLDTMSQLLELQTGPRPRPVAPVVTQPPSRVDVFARFGAIAATGLERTMDTGDLFTTQLGLAELAVALRRYRLDHGQYPDALSALAPEYVSALPIDTSTGQPPEYVRDGPGFRLRAARGRNVSDQQAALLAWNRGR